MLLSSVIYYRNVIVKADRKANRKKQVKHILFTFAHFHSISPSTKHINQFCFFLLINFRRHKEINRRKKPK